MKRTARTTLYVFSAGLLAGLLTLGTSGCDSGTAATNENFTRVVNTYFAAHPDCLFPDAPRFPYETTDTAMMRKMDALVQAQLLTRQQDMSIGTKRYSMNAAGERATARFCYGHREITSISGFTPPAKTGGLMETQVSYHYAMKDVPVWAKTPEVQKAFPQMAEAIEGKATATTTLAQSLSGWQVPD